MGKNVRYVAPNNTLFGLVDSSASATPMPAGVVQTQNVGQTTTQKLMSFVKKPIVYATGGVIVIGVILYTVFGSKKKTKKFY